MSTTYRMIRYDADKATAMSLRDYPRAGEKNGAIYGFILNCDGFPVYEGPAEFIGNFIVASKDKYRLYKCEPLSMTVTTPTGAIEKRMFNPWTYEKKIINGEMTVVWEEDVDGARSINDVPVSVGAKELEELKVKITVLEKENKRLDDANHFFKLDIFKKERRIKALEEVITTHELTKEVAKTS